MVMKIVTSVLIAILVVTLGAGSVFYLKTYKPLAEDYARMKTGLPAYEKANAELKKLKEKESKETSWLKPASRCAEHRPQQGDRIRQSGSPGGRQ